MQPLSENQRPDLLTSLMKMSLVLRLPVAKNASLQILFKCPTPANAIETNTTPSRFTHILTRCAIPCACRAKRHLNAQKWSEHVALLTC